MTYAMSKIGQTGLQGRKPSEDSDPPTPLFNFVKALSLPCEQPRMCGSLIQTVKALIILCRMIEPLMAAHIRRQVFILFQRFTINTSRIKHN